MSAATSRATPTTAVLLMAYGTPRNTSEILPYYTDIRRGRAPTPEQLLDLTARYNAIGGISPLLARTQSQRDALARQLDIVAPGMYHVQLGFKHSQPAIEETVADIAQHGFSNIVALVLAPHYSSYSVGQYLSRATQAAEQLGIPISGITSWAIEPALINFLSKDLQDKLRVISYTSRRPHVLFTAHSLPQRVVDNGDPYFEELRSTACAIANNLGLSEGEQWSIAWQSAGRTPEPWIGPDILTVINELASGCVCDGIVICACGFVADHLEVLYDLDIEARNVAKRHGIAFSRTQCVNDDSAVMSALAQRVLAARAE